MSEEPKKTNKYVMTYEQIYRNLTKVTEIYLKSKDTRNLEGFITSERGMNITGLSNLLIEIPEGNVMEILKKQYISKPNNKGEIGTIEPENQAYEIRNIALLMLMSNRLSKEYRYKLEKNKKLDEKTKAIYSKNEKDLLVWKDSAMTDLLAALYVLKKTGGKEYEDYFSYGDHREKDGKATAFVIDIPYMGQISVHYGNEKRNNIEEAKRKVISILEGKRRLGQIQKGELKRLKEGITINELLPTYKGKLFESTSALPMNYIGNYAKDKMNEIGLDTKHPKEIGKQDIQKMQESGLNEREAHYLLIKLGCNKKQLQEVIKVYGQRKIANETTIGRKSIRMTTAQERAKVLQFEQRNLQKFRDEKEKRAIGG